MNKKLLSIAIGAMMAAVPMLAAQAGVTVFGRMQAEIGQLNWTSEFTDAIDPTNDEDFSGTVTDMNDDGGNSRFGVKASQDMGAGFKGIVKLEWDSRPDGGGKGKNDFSARTSVVGVKGPIGKITLGRQSGVYKTHGGVKWDPLVATTLQARKNFGMSGDKGIGHSSYINRAIKWASPKLGPVKVTFLKAVDNEEVTDNDEANGNLKTSGVVNNSHTELGIKAKFGPAEIIVAHGIKESNCGDYKDSSGCYYSKISASGTVQEHRDDATYTKAGVRLKFAGHKIAIQVESIDSGRDETETYTFVGWTAGFGKFHPVVQWGVATYENDRSSLLDHTRVGAYSALALIYKASKKVRLFVGRRASVGIDEKVGIVGPDTVNEESTYTEVVTTVGLRVDF